jgi:N-acetylmuramoyl-L-alanine amidase
MNMKKKNKQIVKDVIFLSTTAVITALCVMLTVFIYDYVKDNKKDLDTVASTESDSTLEISDEELVEKLATVTMPDYVQVSLLNVGKARSGERLSGVHNIVIHYVANPGTSAAQNRNYFGLAETAVASHFIVGLEGEIIQCVPIFEQSAASNERNIDTISIEVCHPEEDGKFNDATYNSLIKLTAYLCEITELTENDLIRHYDITGKNCPKYYVENPDKWETLKTDVGALIS